MRIQIDLRLDNECPELLNLEGIKAFKQKLKYLFEIED
jgi:hypothetical protein